MQRGGATIVAGHGAGEHDRAVGGEDDFGQGAGEAASGSISAIRLRAIMSTRLNTRFSSRRISRTSQSDWYCSSSESAASTSAGSPAERNTSRPSWLVQPQMQQRVVQFARHRQWPEGRAAVVDAAQIGRQAGWAPDGDRGGAGGAVEADLTCG